MKKETVFMFSGQGSQYPGMGKEFYQQVPGFKERMHQLDEIVIDRLGISVIDSLYGTQHRPHDRFDQILLTQPSLFMIQYSITSSLMRTGIQPDYLLGCSLGECVSLAVSGAVPAEQVLEILIKQAILFHDRCSYGGMIAILDHPSLFHDNRAYFDGCEIAGLNFARHFCIAGANEALDAAEQYLTQVNAIYERLPVRQAFHSRLLDPIRTEFLKTFDGTRFAGGHIPAISAMSTMTVDVYSPEFIYDVVRKPILFHDTIRSIATNTHITYVDLGPSGTLANFAKYSLGKEQYGNIYSIMSPFGNDIPKYHQVNNHLSGIMYSEGA